MKLPETADPRVLQAAIDARAAGHVDRARLIVDGGSAWAANADLDHPAEVSEDLAGLIQHAIIATSDARRFRAPEADDIGGVAHWLQRLCGGGGGGGAAAGDGGGDDDAASIDTENAVDVILGLIPAGFTVDQVGPPALTDLGAQGTVITTEINVQAHMKES
jgi:hypothetical protein